MISDRLGERTAELGQSLQEMGSHVRDYAQERWGRLRSQTSSYLSHGRQRAEQLGRTVEGEIRRHPVRWLLLSAGVGIAIALVGLSVTRVRR
jgi:hypothetical protein